MRRKAGSYLKKQKGTFALCLGMIGVFWLVLYLYNVQTEAVFYAVLLAVILLAAAAGCGFVKYCRRYDRTENALSALPYELRELPEGTDMTEKLYQEKLQMLQEHTAELESGMRIARGEMMDYYSLWAHQIKTPLSAMHLLLQSFEETEAEVTGKAEEAAQAADRMREAQEELLRGMKMELFKTGQYVEMVLSYLRAEEMSADFVLQWYALDGIVCQAVRKYSPLFIMKRIRLDYRKCEDMVLTDEKWLLFVLEQLLSNALKYTQEGTISIYEEEGESGRLVIADTGIGIQAEDLPRIFEKGFTGYNGRQDKKSTGIGLYLCKKICRKLNHGISVESEEGKGTKVYLHLKRKTFRLE